MFETITHAHALVSHSVGSHAAALHPVVQKLNLVGSNTEVYNSYGSGGANEGGNFDHPDHVSPWSPYYTARPIDGPGLTAEGGPGGIPGRDTFACDNDGFGCFLYNKQAFDDILPNLIADHGGSLADAGAAISNQDTINVYTGFGTGAEVAHVSHAAESIPFFYPPRQAGKLPKGPGLIGGAAAAKKKKASASAPGFSDEGEAVTLPPKFCPAWADCTGTGDFHLGEGYDG